jgi:hypothetical protein
MRMRGSAAGRWGRVAGIRSQLVVLSSPYPPEECLRRLGTVTTTRGGTSWYLDPRTAGHPEPRLRGDAGPSRILVARFADAAGRNSFAPWLDARLEPAAGTGTTLTGTIGLHPAVRALMPVLAGVAGLIAVTAVAGGIRLLALGHLSGLVPAVLVPLALAAVIAAFRASNLRLPQRHAGELLREVAEILGPAAASAGPAAQSNSA